MSKRTWTDERVETLKTLWLSGRSAAEIACHFGDGTSRPAVCGKLHRLGLARERSVAISAPKPPSKPSVPRREAPAKPRPKPVASPVAAAPSPPKPPHVEPTTALSPARARILAHLGSSMCRWPLNDPGPGNCDRMSFCAAPIAHEKTCYCREHAEMAVAAGANRKSSAAYARGLRRYS